MKFHLKKTFQIKNEEKSQHFRPTTHNSFAKHENYERETYEAAQKIGENGHDCDEIYPECKNSILSTFSYLLTE